MSLKIYIFSLGRRTIKYQRKKLGVTRFPIAGTSVYENKETQINGVPVDEVREYVDYNVRNLVLLVL